MSNFISIIKNIMLLLLLCISPLCIACVAEFIFTQDLEWTSSVLLTPLLLVGALTALYVFKKSKKITLNIKCEANLTLICFIIGLLTKYLYICTLLQVADSVSSSKPPILTCITAIFIAPIAEEIIFRGIFTDVCKKNNKSVSVFVATISALLWSVVHMPSVIQFVHLFLFGLLLSIIYQKTKNIIACIAAHAGSNLAIIILTLNIDIATYYPILIISIVAFILFSTILIYKLKRM